MKWLNKKKQSDKNSSSKQSILAGMLAFALIIINIVLER